MMKVSSRLDPLDELSISLKSSDPSTPHQYDNDSIQLEIANINTQLNYASEAFHTLLERLLNCENNSNLEMERLNSLETLCHEVKLRTESHQDSIPLEVNKLEKHKDLINNYQSLKVYSESFATNLLNDYKSWEEAIIQEIVDKIKKTWEFQSMSQVKAKLLQRFMP